MDLNSMQENKIVVFGLDEWASQVGATGGFKCNGEVGTAMKWCGGGREGGKKKGGEKEKEKGKERKSGGVCGLDVAYGLVDD